MCRHEAAGGAKGGVPQSCTAGTPASISRQGYLSDRTRGVATAMCKTWAKVVRTQRIGSGFSIHNHTPTLWTAEQPAELSPALSPLIPTACTQIVHRLDGKITPVTHYFSAKSTGPITTTTTYINI